MNGTDAIASQTHKIARTAMMEGARRCPRLSLVGLKPVAMGAKRLVFEHPDDARFLLKVRRRTLRTRGLWDKLPFLYWCRSVHDRHVPLRRELREYKRIARTGRPSQFLQSFVGTVEADLGRAIVVEAVRDALGNLAPTLHEMITSGRYDDGLGVLLGRFIDDLMSSPAVIVDVHLRNIVYDQNHNRLVLIDGIGDKTIVPLRAWSSAINRWSKKNTCSRCDNRFDVYWSVIRRGLFRRAHRKPALVLIPSAQTCA